MGHSPRGCACDPKNMPESLDNPISWSHSPERNCCKVCYDGRACGDTCMPRDHECHSPKGCACDPKNMPESLGNPERNCCKVCYDGRACGDTCVPRGHECHSPRGCACDPKNMPESLDNPISWSHSPERNCCKVCYDGRACGDTCMPRDHECHSPKGCACDPKNMPESLGN